MECPWPPPKNLPITLRTRTRRGTSLRNAADARSFEDHVRVANVEPLQLFRRLPSIELLAHAAHFRATQEGTVLMCPNAGWVLDQTTHAGRERLPLHSRGNAFAAFALMFTLPAPTRNARARTRARA